MLPWPCLRHQHHDNSDQQPTRPVSGGGGLSAPYPTSRRGPPGGGPQQSTEKPAAEETDGRALCPIGLPLYPWGVGLYKPPRAPMQRVPNLLELDQHIEEGES